MIAVIILYAVLASVFPLTKASLQYVQPVFLVGVRMIVGGVLLLVFQYIYNRQLFKCTKEHVWPLVQLTIFNIYLTNVPEFWALQFLDSAKTCFIYNLSPFFAALFSYFLFAERMGIKKWLGLIVGFIGFIPILVHQSPGEQGIARVAFISKAELAVLIAAVATSYGWIVMKQLVKNYAYSPIMAHGISMLAGGIVSFPTSYLVDNWQPSPVSSMGPFIVYMLLITLISNIIGYNVYGVLLKKYTVTFLSFAGFMGPLFAAVYGWFFLGEVISWHFFLSVGIVFIGLAIFYREELKQRSIIKH